MSTMTFEQRSSSLVLHQMTYVHISSGLVLHQMTSDHNSSELRILVHSNEQSSSKLVPKVVFMVRSYTQQHLIHEIPEVIRWLGADVKSWKGAGHPIVSFPLRPGLCGRVTDGTEEPRCAEDDKVKFAICTFEGRALTWWNGNVQTLGLANANQIP
ncbi:hypothetical protein Tco_0965702 [Tanacetum coccineum]